MRNNLLKLPMNLQFFAEPNNEPDNDPQPQDPPADPPKQDSKNEPAADPKPSNKDEHMIPKSRFDEINKNYKTTKQQLDQLLQEKEEAERQAKEQQGEYQSLYEQANQQLETYKNDFNSTKERVEALEGVMTSMLNTKLESIPDEYHDLIPDNLNPEQKLDWISKAETKGLFKDKSQEPVGGPTNPTPSNTDFENMNAFQLLKSGYGTKK